MSQHDDRDVAEPGLFGRVVAVGDEADEAYEQRNRLGQALRRIAFGELDPHSPRKPRIQHELIAQDALEEVFPGDADGELGLYDCPTWDGRNPMTDEEGT